jgi:uncharacterized protein YuzB (UPF0349 family)
LLDKRRGKSMPDVEESYDVRPDRICIACGKTDKAPRDQVALADGNVAYYHFDCHAMMGCQVCKDVLDAVAQGHGPDGKKNEELWQNLVAEAEKPVDEQAEIFTTPDASGDFRRMATPEELKGAGLE